MRNKDFLNPCIENSCINISLNNTATNQRIFKHTVAIKKGREADILSDHSKIEENIKNNPEVKEVSIKS